MTHHRPRTLAAATLLAAAVLAAAVAMMSGGPAGASTLALATTAPTPGTSPSLPNAPTGLHVTAVTTGSITIAWTAATPTSASIASYTINYNQAFNDIYWSQPVGNVTTATLTTGVVATGQYSIRVSAVDTLGHTGPSSDGVVVVTPASDTAADRTPPTAPGNLTVVATSSSGADLSWTGSTDDVGVTGYNVYRFDGLYISTLLGTVTGTTFTAPLPTSGAGSWYVRAKDAAGNLSAVSNTANTPVVTTPATTTPPPAPGCRVTYRTGSQWTGGFVADVAIANLTAAEVNGWTLVLTFGGDQRIVTIWNATATQTGAVATITAEAWNKRITPAGSVSFGLVGSWQASNAPPVAAALNGSACELA